MIPTRWVFHALNIWIEAITDKIASSLPKDLFYFSEAKPLNHDYFFPIQLGYLFFC